LTLPVPVASCSVAGRLRSCLALLEALAKLKSPPHGASWGGMSMLVRWLTTTLPAISLAEVLETMHIPCVAGHTSAPTAVITVQPCCILTTLLGCGTDREG